MLYDNTAVQGSWTNVKSMDSLSKQYNNRIVNNVTMAMPHPGVVAAVSDHFPSMKQPQNDNSFYDDSPQGLGEYLVRASVPSPAVNVLCAELSAEEMIPMIYNQWPREYFNGTQPDANSWPNGFDLTTIPSSQSVTAVDELFGFDDVNVHPIFPKWPLPYNTVFNHTGIYGRLAVYLLAISPNNRSTICSIRATITSNCSTSYNSSVRGGSLKSVCEDQEDPPAYRNSNSGALDGVWITDWPDVASDWGLALGLNDGIADCQSANARSLTQLIPTSDALNSSMPSISEGLAVLAGNALLLSTIESPFNYGEGENYTGPRAKPKLGNQTFRAVLEVQNYAPGSTQPY